MVNGRSFSKLRVGRDWPSDLPVARAIVNEIIVFVHWVLDFVNPPARGVRGTLEINLIKAPEVSVSLPRSRPPLQPADPAQGNKNNATAPAELFSAPPGGRSKTSFSQYMRKC